MSAFTDNFLAILAIVLTVLLGGTAFANWLLRARGGFLKGWAGAVFISACWIAGLALIVSELER